MGKLRREGATNTSGAAGQPSVAATTDVAAAHLRKASVDRSPRKANLDSGLVTKSSRSPRSAANFLRQASARGSAGHEPGAAACVDSVSKSTCGSTTADSRGGLLDQAKELDKALAAKVSSCAADEMREASLQPLVQEAGTRREALQRLISETVQQFEACQHDALRQHMARVSQVLKRSGEGVTAFGTPCEQGVLSTKKSLNKMSVANASQATLVELSVAKALLAGGSQEAQPIVSDPESFMRELKDGLRTEVAQAVEAGLQRMVDCRRAELPSPPVDSDSESSDSQVPQTQVSRFVVTSHKHDHLWSRDSPHHRHHDAAKEANATRADWREWAYTMHQKGFWLRKLQAMVGYLPHKYKGHVESKLTDFSASMSMEIPPPTGPLKAVVTSWWFEVVCVGVIVLNAIFLTISQERELDYLRGLGPDWTTTVQIIETVFCLWYVIELGMKISSRGKHFFIHDFRWNFFDLVLVILTAVDVLIGWIAWAIAGSDRQATSPMAVEWRLLRVVKFVRVLRALRSIQFLEDLRVMLELVVASVTSAFWALCVIVLVLFMFSLIFIQGLIIHLKQNPDELACYDRGNCPLEAFTGMKRSMLTLLQSVTGGVDWIDPYEGTMMKLPRVYGFLFVVYICFFLLVIFNITTGVFVNSVMKLAEPSPEVIMAERNLVEARDRKDLERLLRIFDHDDTGGISYDEFIECVRKPEFGAFLATKGIDIKEARAFFALTAQHSKPGEEINVQEMVQKCVRLRGSASSVDLQILRHEMKNHMRSIEASVRYMIDNQTFALSSNAPLAPPMCTSPPTPQTLEDEAV